MKQKKCKQCKEAFIPLRQLQQVCSAICGVRLTQSKREKKQRKETIEKKKELLTLSDWVKVAQTTFNHYIRLRDEKEPCISCQRYHKGQYHAGHYRTTAAAPQLRFNEFNVAKQCSACNNYKSGNITEYRINLVKKIGVQEVEKLESDNTVKKYSIEEVKEINETYKRKIKELKQ